MTSDGTQTILLLQMWHLHCYGNAVPSDVFFRLGKRKKSDGARSDEYGGWRRISNPHCIDVWTAIIDLCAGALSWSKRIPFCSFPRLFLDGKGYAVLLLDGDGIIMTDYLEQGHTITGNYYSALLANCDQLWRRKAVGSCKKEFFCFMTMLQRTDQWWQFTHRCSVGSKFSFIRRIHQI